MTGMAVPYIDQRGKSVVIVGNRGIKDALLKYVQGKKPANDVVLIDSIPACAAVLNGDKGPLDDITVAYYRPNGHDDFLERVLKELQRRTTDNIPFFVVEGDADSLEARVTPVTEVELLKKRSPSAAYRPDGLYPHVLVVLGDIPYALKRLKSPEEADWNVAALAHYDFAVSGVSFTGDSSLLVEHLEGVETHTLLREIQTARRRKGPKKKRVLKYLQRAILYTQILRLVEHQTNPFIPRDDTGNEIVDNPDMGEYYTTNVTDALIRPEGGFPSVWGEVIGKAADVIPKHFSSDEKTTVRYLDMYSRNHGIRVGKVGASLEDVLKGLEGKAHKRGVYNFVWERFRQFDIHRITKKTKDLEDFWHIVGDTSLELKGEATQFYRVFLAARELQSEKEKAEPDVGKMELLNSKLDRHDFFSTKELSNLVEDHAFDPSYFHAMGAYRSMRWFGLVDGVYLQKYGAEMEGAKTAMENKFSDETKGREGVKITEFRETGNLNKLRFATSYLRGMAREDGEFLATGIRYDPDEITNKTDFYRLFAGNNVSDRKRRARSFVGWLNRYLHSRQRLASYTQDRKVYLEQAGTELRELGKCVFTTNPVPQAYSVMCGDSTYEVKKRRGALRVCKDDVELQRPEEYVTAIDQLSESQTNERVVDLVKIIGMREAVNYEKGRLAS